MFKLKLHWQILIAMAIGILVGSFFYRPVESTDNILEYNKNEDYDDLMKLYHWKYNEIPLSS